MYRFVIGALFVLALYHFARMAELFYSMKKDIDLQISKMTEEDRANHRRNIYSEN